MTSAQRDSFVEKTRSVKTGILKQSVNAGAASPPSTGTPLTAKVGPYFTRLTRPIHNIYGLARRVKSSTGGRVSVFDSWFSVQAVGLRLRFVMSS